MGSNAKSVLSKNYKSSKNKEVKHKLLILLSLIKDSSVVNDTIQLINSNEYKLGVQVLNNLGDSSIKILIQELKKLNKEEREKFSINSKGMNAEILIPILEKSTQETKLKDMTSSLIKNHTRTIRRYCQIEGKNYNNYIKKLQN